MREWGPIAIVAVLFLGFCSAFNSATPYRKPGTLVHQNGPEGQIARVVDVGAPDERQHANYISGLLKGEGFPVLHPGDPNLGETYQSHQPPAYYVIAAGWCKLFGIDPTAESGGFGLRLLSTLIGLATMAGLFFGAKWVFGNTSIATAAAVFLLLPMSVALHSAASNDPLLICLCTWVMALFGLALCSGWTIKVAVSLGVLVGLAFLTKTTAVALLPCLILALATCLKVPETRPKPSVWAIALLVPLLIAVPWWMRNMSLYGDPLAVKAFNAAFVNSPQASVFIDAVGGYAYWTTLVLWWTARSALGVFGYMDIFLFEGLPSEQSGALYVAILFLLSIPVLAGIYSVFAKSDKQPADRKVVLIWSCFTVLIAVLFVRFNLQYFQGQARYLYPAIAPVAWCGATGLSRLMRSSPVWTWAALTLFLVGLDFFAYQEIVNGFSRRLIIALY